MARSNFSVKTKKAAAERASGHCENKQCGLPFSASNPAEFDHELPDGLGGDNSLENCVVLCRACHKAKTVSEDRPKIDKATRLRNKRLGLQPAKRKWPSRPFPKFNNWNR